MTAPRLNPSSSDGVRTSDRFLCAQKIRVALAALQSVALYHESLSTDAMFVLRQLAESQEESEMEPDALARAIILRESKRLEDLASNRCRH